MGAPDWADALKAIERRCAGAPARVRTLPGEGSAPAGAGPYRLRSISYDAVRHEVQVAFGDGAAQCPALRCFIAAPSDVTVAEDGELIRVMLSGEGPVRTLIEVFARRRPAGGCAQVEPPVATRPPSARRGVRHGGSRAI